MNFSSKGSVGVFASGGVDSTMLLYETARNNSYVHAITIAYDVRNYAEAKIIEPIIEKISEYTNCTIVSHVYYCERIGTKSRNFSDAMRDLELDEYRHGITKSPNNWAEDQGRSNLNKDSFLVHSIWPIYFPYRKLNKRDIILMYKQYKLDDLLSLTVSCVSRTGPIPCGTCWWCKERAWATTA